MTEPTLPGNTIHVLTVGMDSRKQAVFRMAFKMYAVQRYLLVDDAPGAEPNIAIVDMDGVDSMSLWNEFRGSYPTLPAVVTTVSPTSPAPAPVVQKPVRIETLFPMLRLTLLGKAVIPQPAPPPAAPEPRRETSSVATDEEPESSAGVASDEGGEAALAEQKTVQPPAPPKVQHQLQAESIQYFNPNSGVFGALRAVRRQGKPCFVSIGGEDAFIILPGQDSALLLRDMDAIQQACAQEQVRITARLLSPSDALPPAEKHNFTGLLWQTALWSCRGRLIAGVSPETPIKLRQWPNLTRLAPTPAAMRIAALWVRFPTNLRITVKMLNVSPSHIFDFLAAAHGIGILEVQEARVDAPAETTSAQTPSAEPTPQTAEQKVRGGLLSRLLRKVAGL